MNEAVSPALWDAGFRQGVENEAFNSSACLSDAVRWIEGADVIVADLTALNSDVMYILGLCHGLGRCPLLITQDTEPLSFTLEAFRCLRHLPDRVGLADLRERLARALRIFLENSDSRRPPT